MVYDLARQIEDLATQGFHYIDELKTLCATELRIHGKPLCNCIPHPRASVQRFLEKAQVVLPEALPHRGVIAATRKKLQSRRKTR